MIQREAVIDGLRKAAEELARYAPMKVNGRCQMYFDGAIHLLKEQDDIVKCKTCKYWDDTSEGRYIGCWCFCDRLKFSTSPEWYCADGEGKTDAAD